MLISNIIYSGKNEQDFFMFFFEQSLKINKNHTEMCIFKTIAYNYLFG